MTSVTHVGAPLRSTKEVCSWKLLERSAPPPLPQLSGRPSSRVSTYNAGVDCLVPRSRSVIKSESPRVVDAGRSPLERSAIQNGGADTGSSDGQVLSRRRVLVPHPINDRFRVRVSGFGTNLRAEFVPGYDSG